MISSIASIDTGWRNSGRLLARRPKVSLTVTPSIAIWLKRLFWPIAEMAPNCLSVWVMRGSRRATSCTERSMVGRLARRSAPMLLPAPMASLENTGEIAAVTSTASSTVAESSSTSTVPVWPSARKTLPIVSVTPPRSPRAAKRPWSSVVAWWVEPEGSWRMVTVAAAAAWPRTPPRRSRHRPAIPPPARSK